MVLEGRGRKVNIAVHNLSYIIDGQVMEELEKGYQEEGWFGKMVSKRYILNYISEERGLVKLI